MLLMIGHRHLSNRVKEVSDRLELGRDLQMTTQQERSALAERRNAPAKGPAGRMMFAIVILG